MTKVEINIY